MDVWDFCLGWGWDLAAEEDLAATMVVDLVVVDLAAVEAAVGLVVLAAGVPAVAGRVAVGREALRRVRGA